MKKKNSRMSIKKKTSRRNLKDDLRPSYDFDFSRSRPNPYASRPKIYHGGARPGAGRNPISNPAQAHTVTIYPADVKFLRSLDPNLSKALRKLIASSRHA